MIYSRMSLIRFMQLDFLKVCNFLLQFREMIVFENVDKAYKNKQVLTNVNLTINSGEFMVLIGSSGCGKTTLLKSINKLHSINGGSIKIDGVPIENQDSIKIRRRIGYVVQDAGLFPHLTVAENISTVLKSMNTRKKRLPHILMSYWRW